MDFDGLSDRELAELSKAVAERLQRRKVLAAGAGAAVGGSFLAGQETARADSQNTESGTYGDGDEDWNVQDIDANHVASNSVTTEEVNHAKTLTNPTAAEVNTAIGSASDGDRILVFPKPDSDGDGRIRFNDTITLDGIVQVDVLGDAEFEHSGTAIKQSASWASFSARRIIGPGAGTAGSVGIEIEGADYGRFEAAQIKDFDKLVYCHAVNDFIADPHFYIDQYAGCARAFDLEADSHKIEGVTVMGGAIFDVSDVSIKMSGANQVAFCSFLGTTIHGSTNANIVYEIDETAAGNSNIYISPFIGGSVNSISSTSWLVDMDGSVFDVPTNNTYSISNAVTDRNLDANNVTVEELADTVATLIQDLGLDG